MVEPDSCWSKQPGPIGIRHAWAGKSTQGGSRTEANPGDRVESPGGCDRAPDRRVLPANRVSPARIRGKMAYRTPLCSRSLVLEEGGSSFPVVLTKHNAIPSLVVTQPLNSH
jgi:hypothetical protein